ncbi:hypothetical protein MMEU_2501 [Mycobacterium marinum str. Europe]|nr:hypothetical protein MMEU_2501 [Mycobacterium marinum str. Europe]
MSPSPSLQRPLPACPVHQFTDETIMGGAKIPSIVNYQFAR